MCRIDKAWWRATIASEARTTVLETKEPPTHQYTYTTSQGLNGCLITPALTFNQTTFDVFAWSNVAPLLCVLIFATAAKLSGFLRTIFIIASGEIDDLASIGYRTDRRAETVTRCRAGEPSECRGARNKPWSYEMLMILRHREGSPGLHGIV